MIGKTLAHYEITDEVGKGGMGEVYRARDTKLGREVALKVLPRELSGDPERAARFEREARALATLQHPNVASIYGFEEAGGIRFLVMELVEGQDLSGIAGEQAMPPAELRELAIQLAAGLEAAHDRGLVHRDLKPANLMRTPQGELKILDFGLARAWFGDEGDDPDKSMSPTITAAMTQAGTILGTAAYMSPEQARGKAVDRRADIWAFGVILFELLTGEKLFEGETIGDTLAAVLRAEPDWEKLPVDKAPELCHVIERCLVRDPRRRLRDIGEARILLEGGEGASSRLGLSTLGAPAASGEAAGRGGMPLPAALALALALLVVGLLAGWKLLAPTPEIPLWHTMVPPPEGLNFDMGGASPGPVTLSPDGERLAFTAVDESGTTRLYMRRLDSAGATVLAGTEGAAYPFWSPDGQEIGFFTVSVSEPRLKKISVGGGPPVTLCPAGNGKGASWHEDGTIVFAPSHDTGLFTVPSIGGQPQPLTELGAGANSHRHPRLIPGRRDLLFIARRPGGSNGHAVMMTSLDGGAVDSVAASLSQAEFHAGHLLHTLEGVLFATPFDPAARRLTGGGKPLVEDLLVAGTGALAGAFSLSRGGQIAFQMGEAQGGNLLSLQTLGSNEARVIGEPGPLDFPVISPDGQRALVEISGGDQEGSDLWLVDLQTGIQTRFTFHPGPDTYPRWSPDGQLVAYSRQKGEKWQLVLQPVDGTGGERVLADNPEFLRPSGFHPDGSHLLFDWEVEETGGDCYRIGLEEGAQLQPVIETERDEGGGVYSPDGRWIAYHASQQVGTWEVEVVPATGGPRKWQLTTGGAVYPVWSPDGRRILVNSFTGGLMEIEVDGSGNTFRVGASRTIASPPAPRAEGSAWTLHPDGNSILVAGPDPAAANRISMIHLVSDWERGLAR